MAVGRGFNLNHLCPKHSTKIIININISIMKKLLLLPILILAIVGVYSCQNEEFVDEPLAATKSGTSAGIRSVDDVIAIADYLNPTHSRSGEAYEIEVITSATGKPQSRASNKADTLLYFVKNIPHPLVIAANKKVYPIRAELDYNGMSLLDIYENPTYDNEPIREILDAGIGDSLEWKEPVPGGYTTTEQIPNKLHDIWWQGWPLNIHCPPRNIGFDSCYVGCVALATFQAMTVTRHINYLNGYHIPWDNFHTIWRGDRDDFNYRYAYVDTLAHLLREVGNEINMVYGYNESTAYTADAIYRFFIYYSKTVSISASQVLPTLKNYTDGIVIISSNNGVNTGHCYVADGYTKTTYHPSGDIIIKLHCNLGNRTFNNPLDDRDFTAWTGAYTFSNSMLYGVQGCTDHVNFTFYSIH